MDSSFRHGTLLSPAGGLSATFQGGYAGTVTRPPPNRGDIDAKQLQSLQFVTNTLVFCGFLYVVFLQQSCVYFVDVVGMC